MLSETPVSMREEFYKSVVSCIRSHCKSYTQSVFTPRDRSAGTALSKGSTHASPVGWSLSSGCRKKLGVTSQHKIYSKSMIVRLSDILLHIDDHESGRGGVQSDLPAPIRRYLYLFSSQSRLCSASAVGWKMVLPGEVNESGRIFHPERRVIAVLSRDAYWRPFFHS